MKKNYPTSIKFTDEEYQLLNEALDKLNLESNIKITKADFIRVAIKRVCYELKAGRLKSAEVVFNSHN